jgi:hypothetical protein
MGSLLRQRLTHDCERLRRADRTEVLLHAKSRASKLDASGVFLVDRESIEPVTNLPGRLVQTKRRRMVRVFADGVVGEGRGIFAKLKSGELRCIFWAE